MYLDEFIEIEKPGSKLFTKNWVPAKNFNSALQQIRDWKRFLIENKSWVRKYLSSQTTRVLNNAGVNFTIIIGKRTGDMAEIEKRNQIADENEIQIRPFDYQLPISQQNVAYFRCTQFAPLLVYRH